MLSANLLTQFGYSGIIAIFLLAMYFIGGACLKMRRTSKRNRKIKHFSLEFKYICSHNEKELQPNGKMRLIEKYQKWRVDIVMQQSFVCLKVLYK